MQSFYLNKEYQIICESKGTRTGFKHEAILLRNGNQVEKTTINYLNRAWESFQYQTAIMCLIDKYFNEKESEKLKENFRR